MFAVIRTGGKQYRVEKGSVIRVEKLEELEAGKTVTLDDVIMVTDGKKTSLGKDVEKATVTAEVLEQTRDKKVLIFKKKRRQNYRRKAGHRQHKTVLRIKDVKAA